MSANDAKERLLNGDYNIRREIRIPMEVAVDERLTPTDKLMAGIFYTAGRCTLTREVYQAIIRSPNARSIRPVKKAIKNLKEFGMLRSYQNTPNRRSEMCYEWIGPRSDIMLNNKRWNKKKSTEVAKNFL